MKFRAHKLNKDVFLEIYSDDKTVAEMASELGVSRDTVNYWVGKLGLNPRYKNLRPGEMKEMVLEHVIGRCMFESELVKDMDLARLGHTSRSGVYEALVNLKDEGLVKTYMLTFSSNGASFGFYDIFDPVKARPGILVYKPGDEFLLGFKIASCLRDELSEGKRRAIYNRFMKTLPVKAYVALKKYM